MYEEAIAISLRARELSELSGLFIHFIIKQIDTAIWRGVVGPESLQFLSIVFNETELGTLLKLYLIL